jgi:hypothetical protein
VDFSLPHSPQFISAITMPVLFNSRDQQIVILLTKPAGVTQRESSSGSQELQDDASQTEMVLRDAQYTLCHRGLKTPHRPLIAPGRTYWQSTIYLFVRLVMYRIQSCRRSH